MLSVFIPSHFEFCWISLYEMTVSRHFGCLERVVTLQPISFRCCRSFSCFSALYPFHFLVSLFTFNVQLSLFTFNLFYTHIFADISPSLWLMRVESASSCLLYLHGVVCEFLPIFTCVIVACIFFFIWGVFIPTYTLYVIRIWVLSSIYGDVLSIFTCISSLEVIL